MSRQPLFFVAADMLRAEAEHPSVSWTSQSETGKRRRRQKAEAEIRVRETRYDISVSCSEAP